MLGRVSPGSASAPHAARGTAFPDPLAATNPTAKGLWLRRNGTALRSLMQSVLSLQKLLMPTTVLLCPGERQVALAEGESQVGLGVGSSDFGRAG